LIHRVEVEGIEAYYADLQSKNILIHQPLQSLAIEPYGNCKAFAVLDPDRTWWTFLEKQIK
ncbi:MAG: hypothetical protein AAF806_23895, partial [Bacteroidota bacterium]